MLALAGLRDQGPRRSRRSLSSWADSLPPPGFHSSIFPQYFLSTYCASITVQGPQGLSQKNSQRRSPLWVAFERNKKQMQT